MAEIYTVIGLMSGTSMDGIDAALLRTDGEKHVECLGRMAMAYDQDQRALLLRAVEQAATLGDRGARPGCLAEAEEMITVSHQQVVAGLLDSHRLDRIDLIGFHGQTVLHRPERGLSVQLGDGARLASLTDIPVISDMRAADLRAGGQGAPLAPIYHQALAEGLWGDPAADHGVVFVNIGGISNVTHVGRDGRLVAFDTGPGNALLDQWAARHAGLSMDRDGGLARAGTVDEGALAAAMGSSYFARTPPKSLDRGDFRLEAVAGLSAQDGARTLARLTARAIVAGADHFNGFPGLWIICGGGRHHPVIMEDLGQLLGARGARCRTAEEAGMDGDHLEAEAWAYLAVRSLRGLPLTFPGTTGIAHPLTGGVLHRP